MSLQSLPSDIITEVCKHIHVNDISSMYYTNSYLQNIIEDNSDYLYSTCQHIQPHGLVRTWWDEEKTILKSEISYLDGHMNGEYKMWYDNGQLSDHRFYLDDSLHGEWKCWYDNGQISEQCFFMDGKLHGEYKEWYCNGQISENVFYTNSNIHGEYKKWYSNGELSEHIFYVDGYYALVI